MARKRICMTKIRKILKLKFDSGLSYREIGRALNISKTIVGEYLTLLNKLGISFTEAKSLSNEDHNNRIESTQVEGNDRYNSLYKELLK